jgi:DNA-binding transcriptional MocR family regulator
MPDALSLVETGDAEEPLLHAHVYDELRRRLITGKVMPGVGLSTRGLASELGVSQMPVRDALSRLAAEGAVQIRSKRKIEVPPMTEARFADLLDAACCSSPGRPRLPCPTSTHPASNSCETSTAPWTGRWRAAM